MAVLLLILVLFQWADSSTVVGPFDELRYALFKEASRSEACPEIEKVDDEEGVISSPRYPGHYPNSVSCAWHLEGKPGDIIAITIDDLDIVESKGCPTKPCCINSWLKIAPLASGKEAKLCGRNSVQHHTLMSLSNKLFIKFHSSEMISEGHGFRIRYRIGPKTFVQCKYTEFQCLNRECVPSKMRCNGVNDCQDGSDESFCSNHCESGFSCLSHYQCYDASKHCDGFVDCEDFSDEVDCGQCSNDHIPCGGNTTQCYDPLNHKCNGVLDCLNGKDELDCFNICPGKIMCEYHGGCYKQDQRCNGITQCQDSSDELNCGAALCNRETNGFLCDNMKCIQGVWLCDGTDDCGDDSDEKNCVRNNLLTAALMGSLVCALLLVIAVSCACRLHMLRLRDARGESRETPLSRMSREFFCREPPPTYDDAVSGDGRLYVENNHYAITAPPPGRRRPSRSSRRSHSDRSALLRAASSTPSASGSDVELLLDIGARATDRCHNCGQHKDETQSDVKRESVPEKPETGECGGPDEGASEHGTQCSDAEVGDNSICDSDAEPLIA